MQALPAPVLISQLQQQTESFLHNAIQQWQLIPHHVFARRPSPAGWSALECLEHLNSYGRYYLPLLEKAVLQKPPATTSNNFTPGWLGSYFTRLMQPGSNGYPVKKMKAFKAYTPPSGLVAHEVVAAFIDQQEQMLHLLGLAQAGHLNKIRIPVSIAPFIRLKLGDVLRFMVAHHHRHVLQAQRALAGQG